MLCPSHPKWVGRLAYINLTCDYIRDFVDDHDKKRDTAKVLRQGKTEAYPIFSVTKKKALEAKVSKAFLVAEKLLNYAITQTIARHN